MMDRVVSSLLAELDGAGGVNFNFGGNRPGADQVAEMYVLGLSQNRGYTVCPYAPEGRITSAHTRLPDCLLILCSTVHPSQSIIHAALQD